jgi:FkbM family methyltransferase
LIVSAKTLLKRALRALLERVSPDIVRSPDQQECYSQEGEDLIVARLFDGKSDGFYVDVGAHHPIRHSNTYLLYRRGWCGINIDATPGSMAEFRRLRPRDINVECLVASDPSPQCFYMFNEPALNTASRALANERPSENAQYKITNEFELRPRSLASLLDEFLPKGKAIDLMSVDVEGLDLDVLRSNDWGRYRPALLLVEVLHTALPDLDRQEIVQFLSERNYRPIAKLYNTVVFR